MKAHSRQMIRAESPVREPYHIESYEKLSEEERDQVDFMMGL